MKSVDNTRFGIGTKLIVGLGVLIAISVVVGGLAILSLLSIQGSSEDLAKQFLPETILANQVERSTLNAMLDTRGYWLSGESKYYDSAIKDFADLQKALDDLQVLLDKSPKLVRLKENLPKARAAKEAYDELLVKTKTATELINKAREDSIAAATKFTASIDGYIASQNQAWESDIRSGVRTAGLQQRAEKAQLAYQIKVWVEEVRVANFKSQALRDPSYIKDTLLTFPKLEAAVDQTLRETIQQANRDLLTEVQQTISQYQAAIETWLSVNATLDDLAAQRLAVGNTLSDLAGQTSLAGVKNSQNLANENSLIVNAATWTIIVGLLASIVLGVIVAFVLIRSITVPLAVVTALANKVTRGDFAIDRQVIKSRDELGVLTESFYNMVEGLKAKASLVESIANGVLTNTIPLASEDDGLGRSLQRMQDSLNEILTQVNVAVDQMAGGSDQVSTAAQTLSQGATEQASSLEEISASANEIHSQSKQNAENALSANQLAKQASQNAELGNQQMKGLLEVLEKMTKSSEETKTIVKTIDDIAFQVNLLALNANVEAARAGKYGKGFAVVAEEVRNLAVRSAAAVNETTRMVEESIRNIQEVNGTAVKTGEQLTGILANANKVADFLEEIAASSQEQARAMGQINGGLDQIDQVTQSNTASAEESASASEELSSQAQQLKVMVSRFQLSDAALDRALARSQATEKHRTAGVAGTLPPAAPSLLRKAAARSSTPANDIVLNDDFDTF